MESARHDMPSPDGNSGGPTKHTGAHLHPRIVATATARIHISPALTFSDFVATPVSFGSAIFARIEANFRSNNSSPPINYPSVYSSSVLRI
jgi:hypothetical protein